MSLLGKMAFSSGRFDVLRETTSKESPEEDVDFDEIPKPSEKAAKKKKKKKKQGHESSGTCQPPAKGNEAVVPHSKRNLEPAAQHPALSVESGTRVKQETRQATDCEPSQSGLSYVGPYSPKTTGTATEQTNESKTSAKKKKKKGANRGVLPSELNLKPPKGNDKAKKCHKDQEGASRRILQPESNASLPRPTEEEEEKEIQGHDENGGEVDKIGIFQSESNISLSKSTEENEKDVHSHHDQEGGEVDRAGILQSESNISLPRHTDDEGGITKALSLETNETLLKPTDGERKETFNNDEGSEAKETVVETSTPEKNLTDLERFSSERTLLTKEEKESQNLHQVLRLIYDVGLTALRNLFMDIHPTWSNKPADAKSLVKGVMKLKGHEATSFNDGNINKWDVSLLTTVLLYSKKCKTEISKRSGFEDAIRHIKDHKNQLLSHPCTDKMSDADYHFYWPAISGHLETIGTSKEEIDAILRENVLENGKVYRDLFLQEVASQSAVTEEMRQHHQVVNEKLDIIISNQAASGQSDCRNQLSPRSGPNWDEWIKFCDNVRNFDYFQNNYILITDALPPELTECFTVFRSVPWKIILDLDPSSEEKGMYKSFSSLEGKNSLINMITPAEIRRLTSANLARHIDANKTQWMFVNGRENDGDDGGPQEFDDWEDNSLKDISAFFRCCSEPDKLDKNKPLVCLILPFKDNTVPFIDVAIRRLMENFNEFDLTFVGITPKGQSCAALPERILKKTGIRNTDLEPGLLRLGMEKLFHISSEQSYCMPTSLAGLPAKLPQTEYLYLKEYLDLLYEGCEDLPNMVDVGEDRGVEDLIEEHRKSFMSGNWISFASLKYNHDAKREISNDIRTHIQRLLDQGLTHSTIVEISHSPGSGGSTIARRVMWNMHKSYPCAFAKLEDHKFDLEDDNVFLDNLADRISALQEICHTTPVILLDGKHARIEAVSNRLVRILNCRGKRAVLLRCNHNLEENRAQGSTLESSDVHATFSVNVRLEESRADLKEFETKYKDHIKECKNMKSLSDLSRVFHFPLFAMLEEFRNKLQEIIYESFDEMTNVEKEIVTVVAFIQRFAAKATPAPLLHAIFQQPIQSHQSSTSSHNLQGVTYEDISAIMTERLCNLMVPANPAKFIYLGRGFKRPNYFQEMYTLQHPVVAEMVLQKAKIALKRDTLALARDFLGFPIFDDIRFIPLMKDLFVLNGCGQGRFSVLFEELKVMHPHEAGDVFCEAAEKTKDVSIVTSAARFYAKVPPQSFTKAKELIEKAFECTNAKEKQKTIYDVKGVVLLKELKSLANCEKIPSLVHLQELAHRALESFRNARTFPRPYFPNPLIGEVKTWVTCIEWITKYVCNGDSNLALQFITSHRAPPFFRTCVSESFNLLNVVDEIVQSVRSLPDPGKTQRESNNVRLSLLRALKNIHMSEGRNESETIQECKTLCSEKMFPSSSQMELKRLQVQYVFSYVKKIENIDKRGLEYLLQLLKDLVEVEKEGIFAKYLMRICVLITGPKQYSLDQGLAVCAIWKRNSSYDALPNFYEMMIYFLKILDGGIMEYRTKYQAALESCREKSNHNCKNTMSTHFLGSTGAGMARLITKNTLFRGEYKSPNNEVAENYWKTKSRKKLMECSGRIRSRPLTGKKTQLTVELKQGNIELYVAKGAGIGNADRNFVPGSMVYFVVSFNLRGPVANGITFNPSLPSRQLSLNDG